MNNLMLIGLFFIFLGVIFLIGNNIIMTGNVISIFNNKIGVTSVIFILVGIFLFGLGGLEGRIKKYDAVIIMGRNWRGYPFKHKVVNEKLDISVQSKMSCNVAAEMYKQGLTHKIIFGTGKSAGAKYSSEAEAMKKYILGKYPDISEEDILTHENNLDTYEEIDEDINLAERNGLKKLALVTVDTQLPRCKRYLENKGKKLDYYSTEEQVEKLGSHYRGLVTKHRKSLGTKYESVKESVLRGLQYIGVTGKFTKPLAKIIRNRK